MSIGIISGSEPDFELWLTKNGTLVDLSAYTFSAKVLNRDYTTQLTKSTGFTGAVGAGVCPTGTPNLVVAWATTLELSTLTYGPYILEVKATTGGKDLMWQLPFEIGRAGS